MMPWRSIITIVLTVLSLLTLISTARDTITPTTSLAFDETLISANGEFALGFFTPPNSTNSYVGLWYNKIPETPPTVVWVANRDNPATNSNSTATLSLTPTGNLTIPGIWSTTIPSSLSHPVAQLLDSGNLVIMDSSGRYAWQGFDYPTDTLIPGMKLGVDFRSDGVINRTLLAWSSYNDPSSGQYYIYVDVLGDPDIYFCERPGRRIWRSGAWDGLRFSGMPEMSTITDFNFFVNNATRASCPGWSRTPQGTYSGHCGCGEQESGTTSGSPPKTPAITSAAAGLMASVIRTILQCVSAWSGRGSPLRTHRIGTTTGMGSRGA